MRKWMVVAVDNARARFMYLEPPEVPEMMSGPDLVETDTVYNPEERARDDALFSERRGGRNRTANGSGHGYDDHRQSHREEFERRFLCEVVARCIDLQAQRPTDRLVLVGDKRILGRLRGPLHSKLNHGIEIDEFAENLTRLAPAKLQAHLARQHQLPARRRPEKAVH